MAAVTLTLSGCGLLRRHKQPAPPYWVTDLGPLPGGKTSQAMDLNDNAQVVGGADFAASHGHIHAVIWEPGKPPRDLGTLDGGGSMATRISTGGQIVGRSSQSGSSIHAVVFGDGQPRDIGTLSGSTSMAFGIDDAGHFIVTTDSVSGAFRSYLLGGASSAATHGLGGAQDLGILPGCRDTMANDLAANGEVVGTADNADGKSLAFSWTNGLLAPLPPPTGCTNSYASAVNKQGMVAGSASDGPVKFHAVVWTAARPSELPASEGKDSSALAINDAGDVVGQCNNHACLWRRGKLFDLNNMIGKHGTTVLHEAVAINNHGQIACNGSVNKQIHAYLLTPSRRSG
jgi:probable HAF family extracellular repeat protein